MISHETIKLIREKVSERAIADREVLEELRRKVRPLHSEVQRIRPRSATTVSLVAADGGNNAVQFDPYLFQLIRVVDSGGEELATEVVSPTTEIQKLSDMQFDTHGTPTALGVMMSDLKVNSLWELSPMIPKPGVDVPRSWVMVYRDLVEWAALYQLLSRPFATDTLLVRDGPIRSKIFNGKLGLFPRLVELIQESIDRVWKRNRRKVYFVGVSKHSKVLDRYRLAFQLEDVLTQNYPCALRIPTELEKDAYDWPEYANRGEDGGEANKFVGGVMFMAKFGDRHSDPIWPVDVFMPQVNDASTILSHLFADATEGFPVPLYPRCLQKAHEQAALAGFDMSLLRDIIFESVTKSLEPHERTTVDRVRMQGDVSEMRYG
jgi:hypothetical protein